MPRCIVIDWDQDRCHLLEGNVTRTGVKIERSVVWAQEEIVGLAQGEAAGLKLKEFLKGANLAPAPLLVCLPKQRILLKDLRCPIVAEAEEPAMVRFQAAKELLENPDDVLLDYTPVSRTSTESLILVAAVRKDVLAGYAALAKGAGLKLLAVTPRPFVVGDLLARCRKIDPVPAGAMPEWSAVLLLGGSWAELTILHHGTVCFARSMVNDDGIDAEVRRSLAMFSTQPQGHLPQILYLFGPGATAPLQERLAQTLRMTVTRPTLTAGGDVSGVESPAGVGLLAAWCAETAPINFVKPKEPRPPTQGNRRKWLLAAGGGVVVMALYLFFTQQMLGNTQREIAEAKAQKEDFDKKLKGFEQDRLDLDALEDWELGTFSWIDEIYNYTGRFSYDPPAFHLTKMDADLLPRTGAGAKDRQKYQARVHLYAVDAKPAQWERFQEKLKDDHVKVHPGKFEVNKFSVILDLAHQPASKYAEIDFLSK